jgi:hypothetical protein
MGHGVQWVRCMQAAEESDLLWIFKPNDKITRLQEQFSVLD